MGTLRTDAPAYDLTLCWGYAPAVSEDYTVRIGFLHIVGATVGDVVDQAPQPTQF